MAPEVGFEPTVRWRYLPSTHPFLVAPVNTEKGYVQPEARLGGLNNWQSLRRTRFKELCRGKFFIAGMQMGGGHKCLKN